MVYASEGAFSLTGYSAEDFLARRVLWEDLVHPDDIRRVWDDVQTAVSARKPFTLTYRLLTRTGEERWGGGAGWKSRCQGARTPSWRDSSPTSPRSSTPSRTGSGC